jgi:hypothetical protein
VSVVLQHEPEVVAACAPYDRYARLAILARIAFLDTIVLRGHILRERRKRAVPEAGNLLHTARVGLDVSISEALFPLVTVLEADRAGGHVARDRARFGNLPEVGTFAAMYELMSD